MSVIGANQALAIADITAQVPTADAKYPLGTIIHIDGKRFKYVKASAALTQYDALLTDSTDTSGNTVKRIAAVADLIVGVANVAVTSGYYFWMQTSGQTTVTQLNGIVFGDPLCGSATAGTAGKGQEAGAVANYKFIVGMALETVGVAAAAKKALIWCP